MSWLRPLTRQVLELCEVPGEQRRTLAVWLTELSIICDKCAPGAPPPELEPPANGLVQVHWILNDRIFSLGVTEGSRCLVALNDPKGQLRKVDPTHAELRGYVASLFDGWKP